MGYKFQFVTLAGFHSLNHGMFELSQGYAKRGMAAYAELQQVCGQHLALTVHPVLPRGWQDGHKGPASQPASLLLLLWTVMCAMWLPSMWLHTHQAPTSAMSMLSVATGAHPCVCHVCSWRWLPRPAATPPPSTSARLAPATLMWSPPSAPTAPLPPLPWWAPLRPRSSRLTGPRGLPNPGRLGSCAPCPLPRPPDSFQTVQPRAIQVLLMSQASRAAAWSCI